MKFSLVLSLGAGLASALVKRSISVEKFDGEYTLRAADIPADAPEGYMTGIVFTHTEKRSTETLTILPNNVERRHESFQALQRLRRRLAASDFYECANANPPPVSADCGVIVSNVLATGNDLIVAPGSCLVFSYRTCLGFFCSLCSTLTTSTDFIGTQLDNVDALCVSGGQAGTIVGDSAPQYQVGFVRSGGGLPNYDVCGSVA